MRPRLMLVLGSLALFATSLSSCKDDTARAQIQTMAAALDTALADQQEFDGLVYEAVRQLELLLYDSLEVVPSTLVDPNERLTGPQDPGGPPTPPCLLPPCD